MFVDSLLAPGAAVLFAVYFSLLTFVYILQNLAFKGKVSESATSLITTVVGVGYMLVSIVIVRALQIPVISTGFLNLFTVGLLLKSISYSHVLNNVRYYISAIKREKDPEVLDEILHEVSRPVR